MACLVSLSSFYRYKKCLVRPDPVAVLIESSFPKDSTTGKPNGSWALGVHAVQVPLRELEPLKVGGVDAGGIRGKRVTIVADPTTPRPPISHSCSLALSTALVRLTWAQLHRRRRGEMYRGCIIINLAVPLVGL